jgi:hypothetical protein
MIEDNQAESGTSEDVRQSPSAGCKSNAIQPVERVAENAVYLGGFGNTGGRMSSRPHPLSRLKNGVIARSARAHRR